MSTDRQPVSATDTEGATGITALQRRRRRVDVDTSLLPGDTFADCMSVIRETCSRFTRCTGWTLTFHPVDDDADAVEDRLRRDVDCYWYDRVLAGFSPIGLLTISAAEPSPGAQPIGAQKPRANPPMLRSRLQRLVFPLAEACDAAELIVRLLNQIATRSRTMELADSSESGSCESAFDANSMRRLEVLKCLSGFDAAAVFVLDRAGRCLSLRAVTGLERADIPFAERELCESAVDEQAMQVCGPQQHGPDTAPLPQGMQRAICVPLDRRQSNLGTVWFYQRSAGRVSVARAERALALAGQFASTLDDYAVSRIAADNRHVQSELHQFHSLQEAARQRAPLQDDSLDISDYSRGTAEVNGDLCEYMSLDEHRTVIGIGDACGHGLPAAVITSTVLGCLRCLVQAAKGQPEPAEIVATISNALHSTTPTYLFMSLLVGIVDTRDNTFRYTSAGHPGPLILKRDGTTMTLNGKGLLLGVLEDAEYTDCTVDFRRGDTLVGFSDGVLEARNEDKELFLTGGVAEAARTEIVESARATLERIVSHVEAHSRGELTDDATLMVVRRRDDRG